MYLSSVITIATILLVLVNIDVTSQHWYSRPVQTNVDNQFSIRDNDNTKDDVSTWLSSQKNSIGTRQHSKRNTQNIANQVLEKDQIIFPDQDIETLRTRFQPITPCEGQTFCEVVPEYPIDLMNKILEQQPHLHNYQIDDTEVDIQVKSFDPETVQLCLSTTEIKYPRKAQNTNGEYMFIFNTPNFTQRVLIETCINEGTPCQLFNDFAQGYVTSCKQKYISRQLMAMKDNTADYRSFPFPSSCCCHAKAPDDTTMSRQLSTN